MMNVLVSAVALLLASAGFFVYDQITFRQSLLRTLSAQAQIIGSNSVSAILFNDPQAATNTLFALNNSPNIASAGILTLDRHPFAQYTRETGDDLVNLPNLPPGKLELASFRGSQVILLREIFFENKPVGFVYLRADLRELDQRLIRYAIIALLVLMLSLLAAILVSSAFRKSVAMPIIRLAEAARTVSRNQQYDLRVAPPARRDEVATLVDSFNEMLSQIQQRDSAIQKAHDELEQKVAERTSELTTANQQLSDRTQQLVSANRELDAFSYSVSHDLRGPLESLNGFSYVLLKQYGSTLDARALELIEHMRASGKRMGELIDDLLNLSRVTTGVLRREEVDLVALARSIIDELCRHEPARKVEFVLPPTAKVSGDARLLRIVMDNLLRNAWKYTSHHERARIEFGVAEPANNSFFVKDDGSGFDPRSADRLFQPFKRLHSSTDFPGSGIGLATVKRIVERHGGKVRAEGAVEQGATIFFSLSSDPASPADETQKPLS